MSDLKLTSFKGRQERLVKAAWGKFLAAHPGDDSIRLIDPPKPDYDNRMKEGESWKGDDQYRTRKSRPPRRRLTSQTSMADGSPLRQLVRDVDLVDVDGAPWFDREGDQPCGSGDFELIGPVEAGDNENDEGCDDPGAITSITDADGSNIGAELSAGDWARWLDGTNGEQVDPYSYDNKPYLLEYCAVCEWEPLPLEWPEPECEFPDSPMTKWEFPDYPMPECEYCHCNGCVVSPMRGAGDQPRYCTPCASRMDNALDRADRRREGANSRRAAGESWAPFLDYLAEYKREMRDRARGAHPVEMPPYPWHKTWHEPAVWESEPARIDAAHDAEVEEDDAAPRTRPSRLWASESVTFADDGDVKRARRMLVENWPTQDREMYCGGRWTRVARITADDRLLTVGQTA